MLEETAQKNALPTSISMSTTEHVGDCTERRLSPWEELPSSPETFRAISNYELSGETNDETPWQQQSSYPYAEFSQSVAASSLSDISTVESSDGATVPDSELSMEDMLDLELDKAVSDVVMNQLKFADIGLYLPAVSADDVESLLSSPSFVFDFEPDPAVAVAPVSLEMGPSLVTTSSFPVYHEQTEVASPMMPEESSLTVTCLPIYDEEVQVPSPASSQSSISTLSCDKKQRKKQQNKTAAQKYRQKKRGEQGLVITEYEQLERRNIELRTRVEEMTREVDYLKGLIEEICA